MKSSNFHNSPESGNERDTISEPIINNSKELIIPVIN